MKVRTITATALTALLPVLTACGLGAMRARVVRIDPGVADSAELHSYPDQWAGTVPGEYSAAWLSPGMLLYLEGDEGALPYEEGDGDSIRLGLNGWSASLSDRVVMLSLTSDSGVTWLEQASVKDLAALRIVGLPDSLPPRAGPALDRLAAANPHVGLSFQNEAVANAFLPRFRPRALWLGDSISAASRLLAEQQQLESLVLLYDGSSSQVDLRGLSKLRRLWLVSRSPLRAERLPEGLEELTVYDIDEDGAQIDPAVLTRFSRLRTLNLSFAAWRGPSDLAALKRLRWVGFPHNTTQVEFAAIVAAHPDLEVIQLLGVDSVTDLAPLRGARHLRALTLGGTFQDFSALHALTSLEFVGLSEDMWEESPAQVAAIRAALPGAVVVKVAHLCLGSGWILLLIPTAMLVMFAGRRTRAA